MGVDNAYFNTGWSQILASIFPVVIPKTAEWDSLVEIVQILNAIGSREAMNHTFFSTKGGEDLTGSRRSWEDGCIELSFDALTLIVCPESLSFEGFLGDPQACYFRLETTSLRPSGVYAELPPECYLEEVVDLGGGKYIDRVAWELGDFYEDGDEVSLPAESRLVGRLLLPACFVVFSKGSRYNQDSNTYDGRHGTMDREQFRSCIEKQYRS